MSEETENIESNSWRNGRAYFCDDMQCFVPSSKRFRRDNPTSTFLKKPNVLKETWCLTVERNYPRRGLYVCEEHFDIKEIALIKAQPT